MRTTNGLERLLEEGRRHSNAMGPMGGEQSGLSLVYAVLVDVAKCWRGIRINADDLEKLDALRATVAPLAATA